MRRPVDQPYETWAGASSTYGLIAGSAAKWPDGPALVYLQAADDEGSLRSWSYSELARDIRRAANLFRSLGVKRGDAVALLAPHTPGAQIALWGAQLAGCAFPINYLLNAEHIAHLLRAAGVQIIVTLANDERIAVRQMVAAAVANVASIRCVLEIDPNELAPAAGSFQARLQSESDQWPDRDLPHADDLAALFHTGGTTGLPKLLRHTHRNEIHTSRAAADFYDFGAGDRMLNGFPLFHVAGVFVYGLSCLAAGGSIFIPTLTGMRNPEFVRRAWQWFDRAQLTHLGGVPTMLAALLNVPREPGQAPRLRVAMTGGSPLPNELAVRFERTFGLPVRNIFGMTECAGIVSIEPVDAPRAPGSVGFSLPFTRVCAVAIDETDPRRIARELPALETGVLAIRGPHVSPGYLDPAFDAGTFTDDGWLISGDLGHVDADGRIYLTGRAKDLIIRSGHNIDPGIIEDAFMAHPAVLACAAVAEPDHYAGELPVAFVVLKPGAAASAADLLATVSQSIAERPAMPKRVVILPEMPLTAIGKIYKPALRALAAESKVRELAIETVAPDRLMIKATQTAGRIRVSIRVSGDEAGVLAKLRSRLAELPIELDL
jgi:fatty-acyl-CoA synthase